MRRGSQGKNLTFTKKGREALLLDVPLLYADTESVTTWTGYSVVQAIF